MAKTKEYGRPSGPIQNFHAGYLADLMFPSLLGGTVIREPGGYIPENLIAELFGSDEFPRVGAGYPYTAADWTVTTTGTGATVTKATTGGVLLTAGSTSTFNTNLQSLQTWTPVASKRVVALARIIPSSITAVGWEFNIGNSQVDPATTNYTDVVGLKMAVGAGVVIGKVRGDSGTQSVTGTLATQSAGVEGFFGFDVSLNAVAGSVSGGFFAGTSAKSYTYTAFSGAQQTQAAAILTTPPSMFLNLHCKGSAGNPTVQFKAVYAVIDS